MSLPSFNGQPSLDGDKVSGGSVLCLVSQSGGIMPFQYIWTNGVIEPNGILTLTDSDIGNLIACTVVLTNEEGSTSAGTDTWGPITAVPVTPSLVSWPATPDDVAALLRARTQDSSDEELDTWTDDTRPTLSEVERLLFMAQSIVLGSTGPLNSEVLTCSTADDIMTQAATTVALLAAMLVELSYFPEQVQSSRSAYEQYRDLFWGPDGKSGMVGDLVEAVRECIEGGVTPDPAGGEGSTRAAWGFPVDRGGLVGWHTRW
jgi:hypothetical protein